MLPRVIDYVMFGSRMVRGSRVLFLIVVRLFRCGQGLSGLVLIGSRIVRGCHALPGWGLGRLIMVRVCRILSF